MSNRFREVAITGIGAVTPLGIGKNVFFDRLIKGESGISEIERFDTTGYTSKIGGEIKGFDIKDFSDYKPAYGKDRNIQFAEVACTEALNDAKLSPEFLRKKRAAIILASAVGGADSGLEFLKTLTGTAKQEINLDTVVGYPFHSAAAFLGEKYRIKGDGITFISACTASAAAIAYAADLIKFDKADIVVTGGVDTLTPFEFACFSSFRSLAKTSCRPFDLKREGLILSEGAGLMVLESKSHALDRGADIYAEIGGCAISNDCYHLSAPDPNGAGAIMAMEKALYLSGTARQEISYINAHGTGTSLNDKMETIAIKEVFKENSFQIPISSTKSSLGHMNGASGAIEAIICALSMNQSVIPPTINYENYDSECDLDYVPNKARKLEINACLSNSYAFGGQCASVVLKRSQNKNV